MKINVTRDQMHRNLRVVLCVAICVWLSGCATTKSQVSGINGSWSEWVLSSGGEKQVESEIEAAMDLMASGQLSEAEKKLAPLAKSEPSASYLYAETAAMRGNLSDSVARYTEFLKLFADSSITPVVLARLNTLRRTSYAQLDWEAISQVRVKDDYSRAELVVLQNDLMLTQPHKSDLHHPTAVPLNGWSWIGPVDVYPISGFEREQVFDKDAVLSASYDSEYGKLSQYRYADDNVMVFKATRAGIYAGETGFEMEETGEVLFVVNSNMLYQLNIDGHEILRHGYEDTLPTNVRAVRVKLSSGKHVIRVRMSATAESGANIHIWATAADSSEGHSVIFKEIERPSVISQEPVENIQPVDYRMVLGESSSPLPKDLLHLWLGSMMAYLHRDYQRVDDLLLEHLSEKPDDVVARYILGMRFAKDSDINSSLRSEYAFEQFDKIVQQAPELMHTRMLLMQQLTSHNQAREAFGLYESAVSMYPETSEADSVLYDLSKNLDWPEVADHYLTQAYEKSSHSCSLASDALEIQYKNNHYISYFSLSPEIQGCKSVIDFYLEHGGDSLKNSEQWQAALDKALLDYPNNISLKRNILFSRLEDDPKKITEAYIGTLKCAEQYYCTQPQRSQMNEMIDRLRASGHDSEASMLFKEMMSLYPTDEEQNIYQWQSQGIDPFDGLRMDGLKVISAYRGENRSDAGSAVYVLDYAAVRMLPNGGYINLTHQITRVLSKEGKDSQGEIYLPSDASVLKVRTIKGDTLKIVEPEVIENKSSITAPNLEIGDYIEVEYMTWHEPAKSHPSRVILDGFFFGTEDLPMVLSRYVFEYPKEWKMDFAKSGPFDRVSFSCKDIGQNSRCTAEVRNGAVYSNEPRQVSAMDILPNIIVSHNNSWEFMRSDLHEQIIRHTKATPYVKKYYAQIPLSEATSNDEKARLIYRHVIESIKDNDEGIVSATDTVTRGVGNRLILLKSLYDIAGIRNSIGLVKSVLSPEHIMEMPHYYTNGFEVVLLVETEKGVSYISPTDEFIPFDYLPIAFSQNTVIPVDPSHEIFTSRSVDVESVRSHLDVDVELHEDGSATAVSEEQMLGERGIVFRNFLNTVKNDDTKARMIIENSLASSYGRVNLLDYHYDDLKNTEIPLTFNYQFEIASFSTRTGSMLEIPSRIYAYRLVDSYASLSATERKNPLIIDGTKISHKKLRFHLPEGYHWNMDTLHDAKIETRFGGYMRKVSKKDGVLELEEEITLLPQVIQTKDYAEFREFCLIVDEIQRVVIQGGK